MKFDFAEIQDVLSNWPSIEVSTVLSADTLLARIQQILLLGNSCIAPHKSDLQPLIRHLLLRESSRSGCEANLRVPATEQWPLKKEWERHGVSAMQIGSNAFLLTATSWHPDWLGGCDSGVFSDAFSETVVRENGSCPADPFIIERTGYESYSSPGQREAVRAAFLMPPGDTLIVNLPTGSGKSLVGQSPALVHHQEGHLTVFVVPTVALAIDQARQMEKYFSKSVMHTHLYPLAWYGGLTDKDRIEIRQRMLNGTQRILFTSPEALTTSLLRTVFEVARNGMLRYLVIDEAHLVTQWGDEFRPAFQALAGLRNSLLRQIPSSVEAFRTLLLSATFTPETTETLASLFGPPDRVHMVSAVHLRPEPQYWHSHANSAEQKQERLLEALRYAPRPFILYVTTREDAQKWHRILTKQEGYCRVSKFDGTTPDIKRKEIIDAWVDNHLDGIVATSAFGVGIDKGDVRTVIHATIPETLDRFYQEVGRGGRDGQHSISLLVYDDSDWQIPEGLATPRIISDELGFARWRSLYETRDNNNGDLFRINLEAVRQGLRGSNDENVKWNMRTILLMARAGFLELDVEPSDAIVEDIDDFTPSSPLSAMASVRIRLKRDDHMLMSAWEEVVSVSRASTLSSGLRNLTLMRGLLLEGHEVADTLSDLYRNDSKQWPVSITKVCGGCPVDRFCDSRMDRYHIPTAAPIYNIQSSESTTWNSL
jgi:ATP-dependent DNA helicase RecQ